MPILSIFEPENTYQTVLVILGGLGIFLYGINLMSSSLKSLAGERLKVLVKKATGTTLKGILTGLGVTVLIQSSSATTVIVIGLISAGLMTLKQSIGVMMGANIGTTVTAFLIGLKIADYTFIIIVIGAILALFFVNRKFRLSGEIILGFGLLFAGLELMSLGLNPISQQDWFKDTMITLSHQPILGVLVGTGLTALVQSSSAAIGVLQGIFATPGSSVTLNAALPILLGCNIGTTITALLASLSGTTESKQAAIFHLMFNLFGTIIFLIFLSPYTNLIHLFETKFLGYHQKITIAFAHIIFNFITTLLVFFLIKYFIMFIHKVLPLKKDAMMTLVDKLNEDLIETSPVLAIESAKASVFEMADFTLDMVQTARKFQNINDENLYKHVLEVEDKVDYYDYKIHDYLMEMQSADLSLAQSTTQVILLDTIKDFERIADHCVNLVEFYKNRYSLNREIVGEMSENLNDFFDKIVTQVTNAVSSFKNKNKELAKGIIKLENEIDQLERKYRRAQLLEAGTSSLAISQNDIHFVDILSNLERISDHCNNIAENVIDPHYLSKERLNANI